MKLLLLHPSENHRWYIQQLLRESGHSYDLYSSSSLVDCRPSAHPTHILSAYRLLDAYGRELVEAIRERWPGIPLLILGDGLDQVQARDMISTGANEFLVLEELTAPVLWRSLQIATIRATLLAQFPPKLLRSLINLMPSPLLLLRSHGPSLANRAFQVQLGYADWQLDDEMRLANSLFDRDQLPGPGRHNLMCTSIAGQRIPGSVMVEEFPGVRLLQIRLGLEQSAVTRVGGMVELLSQVFQEYEQQLQLPAGLVLPVMRDGRQDLLRSLGAHIREICPRGSLLRMRVQASTEHSNWVQLEITHGLPGLETGNSSQSAVLHCPERLQQQARDLGAELDAQLHDAASLRWTFALPQSEGSTGVSSARGRILLMDDDELVRRLMAQVLQRMGYAVDHAADGERAVELYRRASEAGKGYLLVVADLHTKGSGAKELLPQLQEIQPDVRVLLVSGDAAAGIMRSWRKHGFAAALRKPFNISELRDCLLRLLERDQESPLPLIVAERVGSQQQPKTSK